MDQGIDRHTRSRRRFGDRCKLRCRLDYVDGRMWASQWNRTGPAERDCAWAQSRVGLVRAAIEAFDLVKKTTEVVAQCSADQFVTFRWESVTPYLPPKKNTAMALPPAEGANIGLIIITREEALHVRCDGRMQFRLLTEDELKIFSGKKY